MRSRGMRNSFVYLLILVAVVLVVVMLFKPSGESNEQPLSYVIEQAQAKGWNECEASWILEDNLPMLRPLIASGARVWRRYRIYERAL